MRTIPGGGIVSLFARHPNAANLLMILMILFGIISIQRINTQFFPTVDRDSVRISVTWQGASAEDIEKNIIEIIEPEVRFISGVDNMVSYARESAGSITLEFVAGTDMKQAVADVDTAVNTVTNLPEEAEAPEVSKSPFFDRVARLALVGDVPETTLRIHAKKIRDDLIERGIDRITMVGMRDLEYKVEIEERELRRLGLSVSQVSDAISRNSRDTPSGQLKADVEKQIRALAELESPESLRDIEILSFASGEKVLLGEIAKISQGFKDGDSIGLSDGKPAIQITVERAHSADTLDTARVLDEYLLEIEGSMPPGVELKKYEVRADSLVQRISLLFWNGVFGLVLVVGTLFIFLNARIAFWVAAGIPVAMFATLGIMLLLGQTINMITLFALIMMLGIIVDDAIVVGEHTASRYEAGDGPYEAAENGANRMLTPVMAAMTTTVAAFAPMLLISGVIGQIMGVMPYVVIAVIIASLIECFLILPGHLAHTLQDRQPRAWSFWRQMFFALIVGSILLVVSNRFAAGASELQGIGLFDQFIALKGDVSLPVFILLLTIGSLLAGTLFEAFIWLLRRLAPKDKNPNEEGAFRRNFDRYFNAFRDGPFNWMVAVSYRWRYVTVAIAVASVMIFAVGLIRGEQVKFVFFPSPEAENIRARIVFNAGIPEPRALQVINEVDAALDRAVSELADGKEDLVTAVFVTLGSAGRSVGDNLAEFRVQLSSSEVRTIRTPEIVKAWRDALPKIADTRRIAIFETRGGPPGRDIDIQISGGNVSQLKEAATAIIPIISSIDGVSGVSDDLPFGKPELVMELLPRGAALGFTIDEVGRQVRNAFDGAIPRRFAQGDDEVTIRVTRTSRDAGGNKLRNFELRSPTGEFVPLEEVVSLREKQGFSAIQRLDGKTIVSVTADLNTDVMTTDQALDILRRGEMPALLDQLGLDYKFGGRDEERKEAFADLQIGTIAALGFIYIILAWVFGNYFRPIAIMLIIPFGLVGAVFGHWILGFKLTILSFIGLLGLSGILVNDSIILVSRLDERLEEGESMEEAAIGASRDRLRAVLLTSLTTIGGLFPLMFEKSLQAQFLLPMAITIVFGLALATLLVLFLVPSLIGIGTDIGNMIKSVFGNRDEDRVTHPAE
ncbi:MAG: efflux RND transporter permease subunit [Rhizobiaceae bacterium]|nr:efflux RND transporter permease subunit [Rhizobiaceae bacterium]